jgi:hypothetical protein
VLHENEAAEYLAGTRRALCDLFAASLSGIEISSREISARLGNSRRSCAPARSFLTPAKSGSFGRRARLTKMGAHRPNGL